MIPKSPKTLKDSQRSSTTKNHQRLREPSSVYKSVQLSRADIQELATAPSNHENELLLKLGVTSLAKKDITEALDFLNEINRMDLIQSALLQGNESNFEDAKSWISNMQTTNGEKQFHMLSLFRGLASSNPQLALDYSAEITSAQHKEQISAVIIDEWVSIDPKSVFDWIATQEPSTATEHSYIKAMRHEIERSPKEYIELVGLISEGTIKDELCNLMGQHLALSNPEEAVSWMNQLDESAQRQALNGIIDGWSQTNSGTALFDYLESHRDKDYYEDVFRIATVNIAYENPEQLSSRFGTLTKEEQLVAAEHIAVSLSMNDLPQAKSWVSGLESGYIKDLSIKKLTNQIKATEPSYSFKLALDIKNPGDRVRVLKDILENMSKSDSGAALNLLQQANQLAPMERNELKAAIKNIPLSPDILIPSQ